MQNTVAMMRLRDGVEGFVTFGTAGSDDGELALEVDAFFENQRAAVFEFIPSRRDVSR